MVQETFKKEMKRLQEQQIRVPIGLDETAQWWNRFFIVPKPNGPGMTVPGPYMTKPGPNKVNI